MVTNIFPLNLIFMIAYTTKILRFGKKGEKTGWSYIEISKIQAEKLNAGVKKTYRIKGKIDQHPIGKIAILPMGDGNFILPMNADIRKGTGKTAGDIVKVQFELDVRELKMSSDFLKCLNDDQRALDFFKTLPKGHQNYFSKWIDGAKTNATKAKRITMAIIGLASGQGYGEMIRANKNMK
jgi:hypothetical protein